MRNINELKNLTCSGIYVLSFNMEIPMVYHQPFPESDKLIDRKMIKVGKCKNIRKRMNEYVRTYGYREMEPPRTEDYWISRGYSSRYLRKCLGCSKREPHHHVEYCHIEPTQFIEESYYHEYHDNIEKEISAKFFSYKIWSRMEYYKKEVKSEIIEAIKLLNRG